MAQRMNPGLLGAAVVSFALTIAFGAGAMTKSSELARLRDPQAGGPAGDLVPKLLDQRAAMRKELAALERDVLLRRQELERADIDLGRHLVYWREQELLGGIATPEQPQGVIKGEKVNLKEHRLQMAGHRLQASGTRLEALKAEYKSDERQTFPPLDKAIASRNSELQAISLSIQELDAVFQKDRDALNVKLKELGDEDRKVADLHRTEKSRRETKIIQLEERIRELLELDLRWLKEIDPVGNILSVEDRSGRAIIDLGEKEGVFPGLLFEVFSSDKGVYVEKGMLEVIEAKDGIAVCRILKQLNRRMHPLAKDDRIGNPVFNPKRPRTFVVAGDFERYSKADLEAFIRRSGGQVVQKIGPGVDFLVAGKGSEGKEQAQAREYQLLGMTEDQLLKYVLPMFAPVKR